MTSASAISESNLLLTLEEISQLVSHSHDPAQTLNNIVRLIQGRYHTAVCSVYLLEPERGELVLGATVGLKAESVGHVRMRLDEGLTGLVAEQMRRSWSPTRFNIHASSIFPMRAKIGITRFSVCRSLRGAPCRVSWWCRPLKRHLFDE